MFKNLLWGSILLWSVTVIAQEKMTRLNIKEGLWETTHTTTMTGGLPISEEMLAKMPPEQRARMEAAMKEKFGGKPTTETKKTCITKEKLDKSMPFDEKHNECAHTVVSSSPTHFEVKFHCEHEKMNSDGTFVLDALTSESTKGSGHVVSSGGAGHGMNVDFAFTSKYLGPACGEVK